MHELVIDDLHVSVGDTPILHGVSLRVASGEVHAVMGPNGTGKSTLSHVLMGRPGYRVTGGTVTLDGVDLLALPTWERARAGLFLAMQYPTEVPGVSLQDVLAEAFRAAGRDPDGIDAALADEASSLGVDRALLARTVNVDLSGGEKKRSETLQLAVLRPAIAVLDEIDSGLDVDALAAVSRRIEAATESDGLGVLAITHYNRLLTVLHADHVHIMVRGRIVTSGGPELAERLEGEGYAAFGQDDAPVAIGGLSRKARGNGRGAAGAADPGDPFADPLA
jgi:Fe-S cluster assembly ATP-binding protein